MNLAPGVDIVLFIRNFVVYRKAHWVAFTPSKSRLSPPKFIQAQGVSSFCGFISATTHQFLCFGTGFLLIKKIALFSVGILVLTP